MLQADALWPRCGDQTLSHPDKHAEHELLNGVPPTRGLVDAVQHEHDRAHLKSHREHHQPFRSGLVLEDEVVEDDTERELVTAAVASEEPSEPLHKHEEWHRVDAIFRGLS
eukprot:3896294-Prymnesium_polylepis.4